MGMSRRIHLQPHCATDELATRYCSAGDPVERSRWHFLRLLSRGLTATTIAAMTGYSAYWMGKIGSRYHVHGADGIRARGVRYPGGCWPWQTDRPSSRPRRVARQCATPRARAHTSPVLTCLFPGTAAFRTSLAPDEYSARKPALRLHRGRRKRASITLRGAARWSDPTWWPRRIMRRRGPRQDQLG